MRHLSPEEFVELAEGSLTAVRTVHVDECARCREEASALGAVMGEARDVEVPEPSPLFWDHLSNRIREAVAEEGVRPSGSVWARAGGWRLAVLASAVAVVLAVTLTTDRERPGVSGDDERVATIASATGEAPAPVPVGTGREREGDGAEPEWRLVLALADAVVWADADTDGLETGRDALDSAVFELSADERREFARLLEDELGAAGSSL